MDTIPFVGSDLQFLTRVEKLVQTSIPTAGLLPFADDLAAFEYLSLEMPDLVFIDFSDPTVSGFELVQRMMSDPWLLHGGIIALCKDYGCSKKLEEMRGANIVVVLTYDDIDYHLAKVMEIIHSNRRILFQREIGADLVSAVSASYKLENDLVVAQCYANLICNFLCNTGRLDVDGRSSLNLALNEMLINAVEHGNCGVTFDEKSAWMAEGKSMGELIRKKCEIPGIGSRRVTFEYSIESSHARFLVSDEGDGFDWRNVKDVSLDENLFELHGRGILVTRQFTRNLTYNEKGNEVRFEITYPQDHSPVAPALFENIEPQDAAEGEIIFHQNDPSDYLYYIVKGKYDVIVDGKVVSTLSPDDIFMGEMAFLLNNRRSATVRAGGPGRLIKISKRQFVDAIKKKPHYALFLCRLLAQRVQRANAASVARSR